MNDYMRALRQRYCTPPSREKLCAEWETARGALYKRLSRILAAKHSTVGSPRKGDTAEWTSFRHSPEARVMELVPTNPRVGQVVGQRGFGRFWAERPRRNHSEKAG